MKLKTSAIALAVAGTVATPMVVQADGEIYSSLRVGFVNTSTDKADTFTVTGVGPTTVSTVSGDDDDDATIRSLSSRFGAKGETDLGNGLTGFGRFEWDIDDTGVDSARHRFVGVSGDFGKITVGKTWHTFFNHIIAPTDNPWFGSGYSVIEYLGRTDDTVSYAGSTGAVSYGLSLVLLGGSDDTVSGDGEDETVDSIEAALTFAVGDLGSVAVGVKTNERDGDTIQQSGDDEDPLIGLAWHSIPIGDATAGISLQSRDEDSSVTIDVTFGNAYVHYEGLSVDDTDADPTTITVGYTQSLGRNTTMWYEIQSTDNDGNGTYNDVDGDNLVSVGDIFTESNDFTTIRAILKYDIL